MSLANRQISHSVQFADPVLANRLRRAHRRRMRDASDRKQPGLATIAREMLIEYVTILERNDPALTKSE
jgi:hypothetical protein